MKKIFSMAIVLMGAIMALTSCSEDRDCNPTVQTPKTFTVNTPALAEQYIQLSASNKVNLTWSQADYGYNALATYMVQVGIVDNGTIKWSMEKGAPKYLSSEYTKCSADISGEQIAETLCEIDSIKTDEDYVNKGFREIAFRVKSVIKTTAGVEVPGTEIISNTVTYKHMSDYCAIKMPAALYIIGSCHGWTSPDANHADALASWRIFETFIGSNVFVGTKYIEAGDLTFRFYSALTGWDGGASIGLIVDDNSTAVEFNNNVYESSIVVPGKGGWTFNGYPGGNLKMTVDLNQKIVKFEYLGN